VRTGLTQALLDSPMFTTRWRWVIGVALALPRFRGGKKVPPQLARMAAEDLIGAVFPDQIACAENLPGEREIPDHPLVRQAIGDSLTEAMDIEGLERVLRGIESGAIRVIARDLTQPSPLALEVLSARPYAYLDDAPLEERRTQAVMARRWLSPQDAADLGRLDPEAIARVRSEAWPEAENADELHDALVWLGFLHGEEVQSDPRWSGWLAELAGQRRAAHFEVAGSALWIAAERLPHFRALWPKLKSTPALGVPSPQDQSPHDKSESARDEALVEIVRGRLEGLGPVGPDALASSLALTTNEIAVPLATLEAEGFAMRGRFTPGASADEWCERRLLSRIHHYTLKRLRAEIEPVAARDFLRFLFAWQHVSAAARMAGPKALDSVVAQLEGFQAPAGAWESEILAARLADYEPDWLDERCFAGRIAWMRLRARNGRTNGDARPAPVRTTPVTLLPRRHVGIWTALSPRNAATHASPRAQLLADCMKQHGASFFDELIECSGLLRSQVEEALAELVALGLVTSDSFGGLRALLVPSSERRTGAIGRRRRRTAAFGMENAGRWALVRRSAGAERNDDAIEHVARTLLARYGVVFWRLLEREAAWLPPWRELLRVYRRLESRGEVRGGRFVAGFSGEQFALPEAIGMLRTTRRQEASNEATDHWVSVSGADPLNLLGILSPGPKLPALAGNRLLYRDGIPTAVLAAGDVQFLEALDAATEWTAQKALLRGPVHAPPISPDAEQVERRKAVVLPSRSGNSAPY
jgi:ATP-dependent Lhr-like helicase